MMINQQPILDVDGPRDASGRTHEKIVRVGIGPSDLKELHEVVELAVDITADSNWAFLPTSVSKDVFFDTIRRTTYHWLNV